jgi:hypothetical protein
MWEAIAFVTSNLCSFVAGVGAVLFILVKTGHTITKEVK